VQIYDRICSPKALLSDLVLAGVIGTNRSSRVYEDHLPGEADPKREAVMAETIPAVRATETASDPATRTVNAKERARLTQAVDAKVAQGYRIESQSDLQAVLVKDSGRRLRIMRRRPERRELVSVNEWGHPKIEQL